MIHWTIKLKKLHGFIDKQSKIVFNLSQFYYKAFVLSAVFRLLWLHLFGNRSIVNIKEKRFLQGGSYYMKNILIFLVTILLLTSCKQEEATKTAAISVMNAVNAPTNNVSSTVSGETQTFYSVPQDIYEKLFCEEIEKALPQEEHTINFIVPITTDVISDGTFARYFVYAYWGQFSLENAWLEEKKCVLAPYEMLAFQDDNNYQTVLETIHWPESEITGSSGITACNDIEQLLKEKLKNSLSEEKQALALEYLAVNTKFPQVFLQKVYPRNQERMETEVQPKIQTVIEQYLESRNLTIEGYTCLSEKRFKEEVKN